jgi:hypothetical protein
VNTSVFDFVTESTYRIVLVRPDVAYDSDGNIGYWTMVYDEGFEVRIAGRVFFAFMTYYPKVGVDPLTTEDISVSLRFIFFGALIRCCCNRCRLT